MRLAKKTTLAQNFRSGNAFCKSSSHGFTIIELLVVIAVIAILATIVIVSYNGWRNSLIASQVKSDLSNAASAMQSEVTFNNTYPSSIPDSFSASNGVTVTVFENSDTTFCINGVSDDVSSIEFYIDETLVDGSEPQEGTCATRPANEPPQVPTNVAISNVLATTVDLSWTAPAGIVSGYTMQCAQDSGFIYELSQASATLTNGTVSGVDPTTTLFCRVKASNSAGDGPWSSIVSVNTNEYQPPTGLASVSQTINSVELSWDENTDAAVYNVECAKDSGYSSGVVSTTASSPTTSASLVGMDFNTDYYCRVNTQASGGISAWSSSIAVTTGTDYSSLPVGTSIEGYWTTAPEGFLFEDGSAISRSKYSDLFAVIGTTFGNGNGSTTFNLPDSEGRVGVNLNASDSEFDTIGEKFGSKSHTLTTSQIPSHTHPIILGGVDDKNFTGYQISTQYPPGDANGQYAPGQSTGSTGGSDPHNNVQPSIVKRFAIKYTDVDASAAGLPAGTSIQGYWTSAPSGYAVEDGAAVSRTTYSELFSAIGTTYGNGNGSTTFNLPDSEGRVGVNISSSDSEFNSMGEKFGSKTHTLTVAELPSHTHTVTTGNVDDKNFTGYNYSTQYPPGDAGGQYIMSGRNTQSAGGGQAHNNIQPSIVKLSVIKLADAASTSDPVTAGTSLSGYWSSTPTGYLFENGQEVSRSTYADLFAVIGTTYGSGNGSTTFNLPDSRGRVGVNLSSSDTEFDTMGEKYGEKQHALTIAEMPAHSHGLIIGNVDDQNFDAGPVGRLQYPPGDAGGHYNTGQVTASTGSGDPHNNIQPSIVKRFVIKY